MKREDYNKLVRDRIPEYLITQGWTPHYREIDGSELEDALWEKLDEEMAEAFEDPIAKEFADIAEVVYAIADFYRIDVGKPYTPMIMEEDLGEELWEELGDVAGLLREEREDPERYISVLNTVFHLSASYGADPITLERTRLERLEERGAFSEGIFLEYQTREE